MRIQKGDTVFGSEGKPGVVVDRNQLSGTLDLDRHGPAYEKTRRVLGFVNGLRPGEREVFTTAIEKVKSEKEPHKRLETLVQIIQGLEVDPRNLQLVRYLEAEKAHLMYSEGITPRVYSVDETKV